MNLKLLISISSVVCLVVFSTTIDPFHNRFRIGLRFRLDRGKESKTRRPMYSA